MFNALKSLKRLKLISVLIVLQLIIGLFMLNITEVIKEENTTKMDNFNRIFDFENTYLVKTQVYNSKIIDKSEKKSSTNDDFYKLDKSLSELEDMKNEGLIENSYYFYGGGGNPIIVQDIDKNVGKYLPKKYLDMNYNDIVKYASEINVDEEFYKSYNLQITEGRGFTSNDFKIDIQNQNIPLIIGEDYKNTVKIGDKFKNSFPDINGTSRTDVVYEVVGFYKHNDIPILGGSNGYIEGLYFSDGFVISPIVDDVLLLSKRVMIGQYGMWITVKNKEYIGTIEKRLNNILEKDSFSLRITSMEDEYKKIQEVLVRSVVNSTLLGGALIILSIIGISSAMVGEINKRKKEFGIRITQGATIRTIIIEIFSEILILCLVAVSISIILVAFNKFELITWRLIFKNMILMILIVAGISTTPVMQLRKLNPIDLIRGV